MMDNQKLVKKIDELLAVLYEEKKEAKATEFEISLLMFEGELKDFKNSIDFILYKRQILDICKYEFKSKFNDSDLSFNDTVCQSLLDLIIRYAEEKKLDGIKLSNGTVITMFNFGLRLYLHGYSINNIDFLMGAMLGALLND